ncbi:hypothetical protein PsorP6_011165 [Peronosclerospora sorghi]|uniref:Uncharacterized protein n=1 Tax=Peronosclerospora sorghi TaxID=230839 RepID=A0ACC0VYL2_9STRA|nr:hypothetical protein PsorP6_011165 [Peronosclerospora sorghi]
MGCFEASDYNTTSWGLLQYTKTSAGSRGLLRRYMVSWQTYARSPAQLLNTLVAFHGDVVQFLAKVFAEVGGDERGS